ncbi:3-oxoacyl-[acyl-carrier-protein] reductase [Dethiobacter alkaliphilus]|uniref:3-oxoacyl-[acyl-carrier-protein] reductase n=1 Tax=Dethiobacter alkaliphilus AHT 1 TaxID=555088 RepID=C0GHK8_DETAL|nr:3-oxoacyl-[acyl-carrier-protein] reductase [Dethiobacter alkaliphilus]EEG77214.1 3-oxoacyl-(acyl-carrier-protein) reductase [Dethiobacter alkaliphilus AHT 1]
MRLEGKVAIVTGASRGIGRAIAVNLAQNGASVVINYSASENAALETLKAVEEAGSRGVAVQANVAEMADCEKLVKAALDNFGKIDILVNNAGITRDNIVARMKPAEWQDVIDTNLTGAFNCVKAAMRPLLKQKSGGRIINVSSVIGLAGGVGQANYAAAKAGLLGMTKSLARELAGRQITVNAIAPGYIDTEMTAALADGVRESITEQIPLGRVGTPEDVAELVSFLASGSAGYLTGQVIAVDGGLVMQ